MSCTTSSCYHLLAKPAPHLDQDDEDAVKKHYNPAKYQVLQDPKLVRLICEFVDWKPYPDENEKK